MAKTKETLKLRDELVISARAGFPSKKAMRICVEDLLDGTTPVAERMSICAGNLYGIKRPSVNRMFTRLEMRAWIPV